MQVHLLNKSILHLKRFQAAKIKTNIAHCLSKSLADEPNRFLGLPGTGRGREGGGGHRMMYSSVL